MISFLGWFIFCRIITSRVSVRRVRRKDGVAARISHPAGVSAALASAASASRSLKERNPWARSLKPGFSRLMACLIMDPQIGSFSPAFFGESLEGFHQQCRRPFRAKAPGRARQRPCRTVPGPGASWPWTAPGARGRRNR